MALEPAQVLSAAIRTATVAFPQKPSPRPHLSNLQRASPPVAPRAHLLRNSALSCLGAKVAVSLLPTRATTRSNASRDQITTTSSWVRLRESPSTPRGRVSGSNRHLSSVRRESSHPSKELSPGRCQLRRSQLQSSPFFASSLLSANKSFMTARREPFIYFDFSGCLVSYFFILSVKRCTALA